MRLTPCPSCEAMAPEGATSCKFCGARLDPYADGPAPARDDPESAASGEVGRSATRVAASPAAGADVGHGEELPPRNPEIDERGTADPGPTPPGPSPWSRSASGRGDAADQGVHLSSGSPPGSGSTTSARPDAEATPPDPNPRPPAADAAATGRADLADRGSAPDVHPVATPAPATVPPRSPGHRAATQPSAGARAANRVVRIVVVCLALVVIGAVVLIAAGQFGAGPIGKQREAVAGRGDWVTYNDPGGAFTVQLPTEPSVSSRQTDFGAPWQSVKSQAGLSEFEVSTVNYQEGLPGVYAQQWLDRQPAFMAERSGGKLLETKRTSVQGNAGIEYAIESPDGWFSHGAVVIIGRRAYLFQVVARSDSPEGLQRMLQTFTPLPATQR